MQDYPWSKILPAWATGRSAPAQSETDDPLGDESIVEIDPYLRFVPGAAQPPAYVWVSPPGVGDAPQFTFRDLSLVAYSPIGPGDPNMGYIRTLAPNTFASYTNQQRGLPIEAGGNRFTPLSIAARLETDPQTGLRGGYDNG